MGSAAARGKLRRALWRVLALVSVRGSIHYVVLPDCAATSCWPGHRRRADVAAWWRLTGSRMKDPPDILGSGAGPAGLALACRPTTTVPSSGCRPAA